MPAPYNVAARIAAAGRRKTTMAEGVVAPYAAVRFHGVFGWAGPRRNHGYDCDQPREFVMAPMPLLGSRASRILATHRGALNALFAAVICVVALYVIYRSVAALVA